MPTPLPVFKVYRYDAQGDVAAIYVFKGQSEGVDADALTDVEREYVSGHGTDVVLTELRIHLDDPIHAIKHKIVSAIGVDAISSPELYLFARARRRVAIADVYDSIATGAAKTVTPAVFAQIADNLGADVPLEYDGSRDALYDDLARLQLCDSGICNVKIPLGRDFARGGNAFTFATSPYKCAHIDAALLVKETALRSVDNWLLLTHGEIVDNVLHLCTAEDVFAHYADCVGDQSVLKRISLIYFPHLYDESVFGVSDLAARKPEFLAANAARKTELLHHYRTIDAIHETHAGRTADANFSAHGVREIAFTFRADRNVLLPLETIFKNIHASRAYPIVVYHPGGGKERRMRLFCDKLADVGKRVPKMKESVIKRVLRQLPREASVSILFCAEWSDMKLTPAAGPAGTLHPGADVLITVDARGDLRISRAATPALHSVDDVVAYLRAAAEPVVAQINDVLRDAGHQITLFDSLRHDRIHDMALTYVFCVTGVANGSASIFRVVPCMSSVFAGVADRVTAADLIYKRVEDYHHPDVSVMDAFILDTYKTVLDANDVDVARRIVDHFPGSAMADAFEAIESCAQKYPLLVDSVRENRGFPTRFYMDTVGQPRLEIEIAHIASVRYLPLIRVYIETVVLMTQNPAALLGAAALAAVTAGSATAADIGAAAANMAVVAEIGAAQTAAAVAITFDDIGDDADADAEGGDEDDAFDFDDFAAFGDPAGAFSGGGKPVPAVKHDTDSATLHKMSITDPSYFFKRIQALEPSLVLSRREGTFDSYSRLCPANLNRQPVIITEEEKAEIDANHPGSYGNALKYGSNDANPYWYICPRYWCLKTGTSMTEEEVKSGVCGAVIPAGAKTPTPGHYVVQLTGKQHFAPDGSFVEHNPGFLKEGLHPDGKCMACCFAGKWDSKMQQSRRATCNPAEYGTGDAKAGEATGPSAQDVRYIMNSASRVDRDRWGFLPDPVQSLLRVSYTGAMSTPHSVRPGYRVLLQYGVDDTVPAQSFVGCVAEMFMHSRGPRRRPTIPEMRQRIADAVSLDDFLTYNNGGLVSLFAKGDAAAADADLPPSVLKYSKTAAYKRVDADNVAQYRSFVSAVTAYESFLAYLTHPSHQIDHTYLWDVVCRPNPRLVANGCNIVMLRVPEDDATQNVEVVCPTNTYSSLTYDPHKDTFVIILRIDNNTNTYSMAFFYKEDRRRAIQVERAITRTTTPTAMDNLMNTLYEIAGRGCQPTASITIPYTRNIEAAEAREVMQYYGIKVVAQVINYQSKVVGLRCTVPGAPGPGVVPVRPSAIEGAEPAVYMDQPVWLPVDATFAFLKRANTLTSKKLPCAPAATVVDDGMAVGVLTETNQFVMFSAPAERAAADKHGLRAIAGPNYVLAERELGSDPDPVRRGVTMRLALENNMYVAFRALVRQVLNDPARAAVRRRVTDAIFGRAPYLDKLADVIVALRAHVEPMVCFADMDVDAMLARDVPATSPGVPDRACFVGAGAAGGTLYVSARHLVSGADNRRVYFAQAADELVRYNRIRYYMLRPRILMPLSGQTYHLRHDEILLMQSALAAYLTNLRIVNFNPRITQVSYESARPRGDPERRARVQLDPAAAAATPGADADTHIGIDDSVMLLADDACIETTVPVRGNRTTSIWVRALGPRAREVSFAVSPMCGFSPILYIARQTGRADTTLDGVKARIAAAYARLDAASARTGDNLRRLLRAQGKRAVYDRIRRGDASLEDAVMSADYYMSELDIWAMFDGGDVPVIMFYSTPISAATSISWIYLPGPDKVDLIYTKKIYFVRGPARSTIRANEPSAFTLVVPAMEIGELGEFGRELGEAVDAGAANIQRLKDMIDEREFHVPVAAPAADAPLSK
jgi:hypothetical protein